VTIGNRTSTFDGLIGMLERGEIDVALADLSLTPARAQVWLDFETNISTKFDKMDFFPPKYSTGRELLCTVL
jgi:hypothetical protein